MIDTIYESIVESIGDNEVVIYWMYWLDIDILIYWYTFIYGEWMLVMDIFDIDYIYMYNCIYIYNIIRWLSNIYIYKL